jgi:trigger factor
MEEKTMSLKTSNKSDVNMWELEFKIEGSDFDAAVQKVYLREKNKITIKGFRKGKATRKMIERVYGSNVFYEDAINNLLGPEIDAAIKELNLELVDTPKVELKSVSIEDGVELTVACVVKPEIEVSDYKGIHAPKPSKEVTDEDVNASIDTLRQRNARIVSVDDRAAQLGDEVNIDFEGFVDGEAFDGGKGEGYPLKLGSGQFIPGFEDQIVGKNIGEEFDVNVTFPEEYGVDTLAGKPAVFKCKVNSISVDELPELDDEFVKDATEFETVDELKADTKKKLEEEAETAAENSFTNAVMDVLISKVTAPVPHVMYEHRVDALMNNFESSLKQQGLSMELYLQYTGMDVTSIRETYMDRAVNEVKLRLALDAIAKAENLEITDAELDDSLSEIARSSNLELDKVKQLIPLDDYKADLLATKAMDLVKDSAVVDNDIKEEEKTEE